MSVRIKVCGVIHPDDARAAVDAGADLIGLNFVPGSPRELSLAAAAAIAEAIGKDAERVGIFRNAAPEEFERVLRRVELERLQFHGEETPEDVEAVDLPVIKAIPGADEEAAEAFFGTILLLDHPTSGGGKGQAWDWSGAADLIAGGHDVIVAGGLHPDNVGAALEGIGDLLPWGVDVATGVEGDGHRKDPDRIARFIAAVRAAEEGS